MGKVKTQSQYEDIMEGHFRQVLGGSVSLPELLKGDGAIQRKGGEVDRRITHHDPLG